MAFTQAEKIKILKFCKIPAKAIRPNTIYYNSWLAESRLANNEPETEEETRTLISRVDEIDVQLRSSTNRLKASSFGDVQLNPEEMMSLRRERKKVIREIRDLLDLYGFDY